MTGCGPTRTERFGLGTPTEYGFRLPRLRHALARPHVGGRENVLLDFGCGNGANTALFAPDCDTVVGVDVAPEHLTTAAAHARRQRLTNLSYLHYGGDSLPFPDSSFDAVVSFEALEHTADDGAALNEIRRVLAPSGTLTITVPNKWYLMETHGFDLPPRAVKWNRVPLLSWLPTPLHERYANARIYSRKRIEGLLTSTGFEVVQHRYIMPPFDRVTRRPTRNALRSLFSRIETSPLRVLGVAHFIVARPAPVPGPPRWHPSESG